MEDGDHPFAAPAIGARTDAGGTMPLSRRRRGWIAPVVLALLAFLAGIVGAGYAIRRSDRIAAIVRPAVAVASLPATPMPAAPVHVVAAPAALDAATAERIGKLEAQIGEIGSRAAEASGDADRAEGLLVAFAARRALDRGQPMGFLEPMLRRHFGATEPQAVATIIAASLRPVTLVQLEQRLDELAPTLRRPAASVGWWQALRHELGTLVIVRKDRESSDPPADQLARADRALALGRVDLALDDVARLPGAPSAGDWIAAARRYVQARNALDRIETAALLAPDTSAGAPAAAPVD